MDNTCCWSILNGVVDWQKPFSIESNTQSGLTHGIFHFRAYSYLSPSGVGMIRMAVDSMSSVPE